LLKKGAMRRERDSFQQAGFTLIEVLVASVIASIIIMMVYTAYRSIMISIRDMTGYSEFYENVNLAVSRINRDISNTYFNRKSRKIAFVSTADEERSSLNFVTVDYHDYSISGELTRANPQCGIRETGYFIIEDPEVPAVYLLMRREQMLYDDDPLSGGIEDILLENVTGLKFEFRKQNDWSAEWDSRSTGRFPPAVRTTLKVKNYRGKEETFVFVTCLSMNTK